MVCADSWCRWLHRLDEADDCPNGWNELTLRGLADRLSATRSPLPRRRVMLPKFMATELDDGAEEIGGVALDWIAASYGYPLIFQLASGALVVAGLLIANAPSHDSTRRR